MPTMIDLTWTRTAHGICGWMIWPEPMLSQSSSMSTSRSLAPGGVAVALARAAGEHPAARKAMGVQHQNIAGHVIRVPVRTQVADRRARVMPAPEFRHGHPGPSPATTLPGRSF